MCIRDSLLEPNPKIIKVVKTLLWMMSHRWCNEWKFWVPTKLDTQMDGLQELVLFFASLPSLACHNLKNQKQWWSFWLKAFVGDCHPSPQFTLSFDALTLVLTGHQDPTPLLCSFSLSLAIMPCTNNNHKNSGDMSMTASHEAPNPTFWYIKGNPLADPFPPE